MRNHLKKMHYDESGAGELINALIVLPILLILIFSIFNVGTYFLTLGNVTREVANSARQIAMYGGNDSRIALNKNGGKTISQSLYEKLYNGGKCTLSACTQAPTNVRCTSKGGIVPGSTVSCTVTYHYKSFMGGTDFGIGNVLQQPKTITQYSVSENWGS